MVAVTIDTFYCSIYFSVTVDCEMIAGASAAFRGMFAGIRRVKELLAAVTLDRSRPPLIRFDFNSEMHESIQVIYITGDRLSFQRDEKDGDWFKFT